MLTSIVNPNHWANRGCVGWWPALSGLCYGLKAYAAYGRYDLTLTNASGTDARQGIIWSPTVGTNAGALSSVALRPGALGSAFLGPFKYASTTWYGSSTIDISASCPTEGTMALWLRPQDNSTVGYVVCQYSLASNIFFRVLRNGSPPTDYLQAGFYKASATTVDAIARYGSPLSLTSWIHVAFTWKDSATTLLYVNGAQVGASSQNYSSAWSLGSTLNIGFNATQATFPSIEGVDDLCLWNRRLSDQEIWSVYSQSLIGWPGRLAQSPWWRLPNFKASSAYSYSGVGGMPQGGDPTRTSAWIMPGIGGLTDGGRAARATAFGPAASGGLVDGGDTAAPLAWDTFTGTSGTLLQNHTPDDGGAWLKHPSYSTGDARLNGSGAVYSTSTNGGVFLHSHVPASADYTVSCDLSHVSNSFVTKAGVSVRWDSTANTGYTAYATNASGNKVWLQKTVAGTTTSLGNAVSSWDVDATDRLSLSVIGTSLRVYWDGALVIGPITDSSISSAGQAGLYTSNSEITADNWTSTGGGVQAQYHLAGSGGEELGGFAPGGNIFVQPCSGGVYQGGKRLGPIMDYGPSAAGGTRDGGFAGPHLLIVETASGGTELGGEVADVFVVIATSGGMAAGGKRLGPVMDYGPSAIGGIRESGLAESTGIYVIEPAGGQYLGGTSQIILGILYRLYANDGAGGPIDYSTVLAATATLSYALDPLTGPGVWSFGVRAYDTDLNLEDLNIDAVVTVRLDAASHDITNIPAPPLALTGHAGSAGSAVLSWQYQQPEPGKAPTGFRIYQGTGSVNYSSPVATVPWGGQPTLSATIPGLTDSTTYLFGVRAYNATGEEPNTSTVAITAKVSAPSAPASITISAVA